MMDQSQVIRSLGLARIIYMAFRAIFIPIRPRLSAFHCYRFLSGVKMPLPSTDLLYVFAVDCWGMGFREQAPESGQMLTIVSHILEFYLWILVNYT
jgi:hypothetical protein